MPRPPLTTERLTFGHLCPASGFSLIECLVATALLTSGAAALAVLLTLATGQMTAARHRTAAAVLARARLEQLVADADAGNESQQGDESVDVDGTAASGPFRREWAVVPLSVAPDHLLVIQVRVTSNVAGLRADDTTLTLLRRRRGR